MARATHFYKPGVPTDGEMCIVPCAVLWESDPDEYGQFAVFFEDEDGEVWAAHADMESHSLFFNPVWLFQKQVAHVD